MDKFTAKLAQYLEDGLTEIETITLEAHLVDCPICQTEFDALTQFDHLLSSTPMIVPSPNFVSMFETKLERRLNRRRTLTEVLVLGTLLAALMGVLAWNLVGSEMVAWQWISNGGLWNVATDVLSGILLIGVTLGKIAVVMFDALTKLVQHPVLWGYTLVGVGLVWLWVQLFRWTNVVRLPVLVNSK